MQAVKMTVNYLTGNGWKDAEVNFSCDEKIGLNAGKDIFATARGTGIMLVKKNFRLAQSMNFKLLIDNNTLIVISFDNGKFIKSDPINIK